jgi:hypothetical protein
MSNTIKLSKNDSVLYLGSFNNIKDLLLFGDYVFDRTVKRLIYKSSKNETTIDIDNKRRVITDFNNEMNLNIDVDYYIENEYFIEFCYYLDDEKFKYIIEMSD